MPWLTVREVTKSSRIYLTETRSYLTEKGVGFSRVIPEGTVVLTNSGATLGVAKITSIETCANDGIAAFFELRRMKELFLYYLLNARTDYFREDLAPGLGQPNLNTSIISGVLIPLPPLPEQRRIAAALSDADALLAGLDALVAKKELVKRGVMEELLSGERRLAGFAGAWESVSIGNLTTISKESVNPANFSDEYFLHYSIPSFDEFGAPQIEKGETIASQKFIASVGQLMFSKLNPRKPRVWRVEVVSDLVSISSTEFVVLNCLEIVDVDFMYYALQSDKVMRLAAAEATGTTRSHQRINPNRLLELEINFTPSLPEQRAIAAVLTDLDGELSALRARRAKVALVKAGMMEVLLTGAVRV